MKKKIFALIFMCGLLIGITGCDNKDNIAKNVSIETQNEESVDDSENGYSFIEVDDIPFDRIQYNDEFFSLKSVSGYVSRTESGHGYRPYVVLEFDLSTLSEDEHYWLMKDWGQNKYGEASEMLQTFGVTYMSISSDKNDMILGENLVKLAAWEDGKTVYYVFYLPSEYKHDFYDMTLGLNVEVRQDETYEYKNDNGEMKKANKTINYSWTSINWEYNDMKIPVLDIEDMPENIKDNLNI